LTSGQGANGLSCTSTYVIFRTTFWLTDDAKWRLVEFLGFCGVAPGTNALDALDKIYGAEVVCHARQNPQDDGRIFNEITRIFAHESRPKQQQGRMG
jgi:hypothetical protein